MIKHLRLIITPKIQTTIKQHEGVPTMKKADKMAECTVFDHDTYGNIEKTIKSAMRLAGYRSQFNKQDCQDYSQDIMIRLCTLAYNPDRAPVECFVRMVVKGQLINIINSKDRSTKSVTDYFEQLKGEEWDLDSLPCYKSNHLNPLEILLKDELWAMADEDLVKKFE